MVFNAENRFTVTLSGRVFLTSFVAATIFAFAIGRTCRPLFVNDSNTLQSHQILPLHKKFPSHRPVVVSSGNPIPDTTYTSKQFDTRVQKTSVVLTRSSGGEGETSQSAQSSIEISADGSLLGPGLVREKAVERSHDPTGQHLLVDIENVDGDFLNSQERLAEAMVTLVETSGLTMLSYHCHHIGPVGVSCVGILLECHVTLHTWPVPGDITLDLFACGSHNLLTVVERIESLFGIPRTVSPGEEVLAPHTKWAIKNRGFDRHDNPEDIDLDEYLLAWLDFELKEEVVTAHTAYQTIEIFDLIHPRFRRLESYERSLSNDGSYESQHPEFFRPDRIVYLDKIMQSRWYGQKEYHETLVHPAMFAHPNPKRVAIIGGGEGATLREVLKHKTVEGVTMVEIDKEVVDVSRHFLPEWSSCEDIVGSRPSCFDDPRATVLYTDAIAWFLDHFGTEAEVKEEERFDVIIMDALDPSSVTEFSDALYNNSALIAAISNSLTADGVLIAQLGQAMFFHAAPRELTRQGVLDNAFIPLLEKHGFVKIKEYDEGHGGFLGVWGYIVAFKDRKSGERWYANDAVVDLAIKQRIRPTVSGASALHFFDGALMESYANPSRIFESNFCLKRPPPALCSNGHGFDPEKVNAPISSFVLRNSTTSDAGRGVFFKESFPEGTYIAIDNIMDSILIRPKTRRAIKEISAVSISSNWNSLDSYVHDYGFATDFYGDPAILADASVLADIKHGCSLTDNFGRKLSVSEMTADVNSIPPEIDYDEMQDAVYNPCADRNHLLYKRIATTNRDVHAGEELKDNFLHYLHEDNWKSGVEHYRSICSGKGKGVATDYDVGSSSESS